MYILQIDFPFDGPFAAEMAQAMRPLAEDIATENDLLWKIWTEDAGNHEAGGIYLFAGREAAEAYLARHSQRLQAAGVSGIRSRIFSVNQPLSHINRAPL
ncbi:monooxygenase [Thiopseudomonas denitrificans]|uniref:Putative monooxygenase ydhR n=1 Tax=Thiopseudomonas denitrificans TaxID=1501432 RepID=A0A4R6U029_9GAMM|nr:monooxygenase [Thiopseudomonas denitrificans]TDQ39628.1 putative monooxygenase ydhR [Thiopseudomonas denitrificans]